jgi:formylmethanofuran dehydrogenase subunit E
MQTLDAILEASARRHKHLCPRQVLGARMSMLAGAQLGLTLPRADKRLLVIAETDGCTVDGISAATGCHVGGRTLRILDFGKVAATFTDTHTETSLRLSPSRQARTLAFEYASRVRSAWEAMLLGYQVMPASELLIVQPVQLERSLAQILSRPGKKVICNHCGEEVINGREVLHQGVVLCLTCAGSGYYHHLESRQFSPGAGCLAVDSQQ